MRLEIVRFPPGSELGERRGPCVLCDASTAPAVLLNCDGESFACPHVCDACTSGDPGEVAVYKTFRPNDHRARYEPVATRYADWLLDRIAALRRERRREQCRRAQQRYTRTDKGRACHARYEATAKGRDRLQTYAYSVKGSMTREKWRIQNRIALGDARVAMLTAELTALDPALAALFSSDVDGVGA